MAKQKQDSVDMGAATQPIVSTQDYFTIDIQDKINKMSEAEMSRELLNLEETRTWIAMLKYNQARLRQSQTAVLTGDPVKDPTNIARNQGIMIGVCDLQNAVIILKQNHDEESKNLSVED